MINPQYCNIMRSRDSRWIFLFIRREASKIREEEKFSAIRLDLIIRGTFISKTDRRNFYAKYRGDVLNLSNRLAGLNVTHHYTSRIFFRGV